VLFGHLKIALSLVVPFVPFAPLFYAKQVRLERDRQAILREVQHPLNLQWSIEHPQESLQMDRVEARYLRQLIWDLDH
jgi:hypothetical protein